MPAFISCSPYLDTQPWFYRKSQIKLQYHHIAAHDYSAFAQANAQLDSWTQEAPEAFNRCGKLDFLYFLSFVARTAVILKSRSSRSACSTAKQPLTIKCPIPAIVTPTLCVFETFFCHCYDSATTIEAVKSIWCYFNSHFSSQPAAPEGHWMCLLYRFRHYLDDHNEEKLSICLFLNTSLDCETIMQLDLFKKSIVTTFACIISSKQGF